MNRKRIMRLWRLEGHRVPPRRSQRSGRKALGTAEKAIWNLPAQHPNHVWSYDFMGTRTREGAPIRILNVVDEYTRVALGSSVARSIGAGDVIADAHALGLYDVAEGVEEEASLTTLASLGCDLAQGYYIAKPAAAEELQLPRHLVA